MLSAYWIDNLRHNNQLHCHLKPRFSRETLSTLRESTKSLLGTNCPCWNKFLRINSTKLTSKDNVMHVKSFKITWLSKLMVGNSRRILSKTKTQTSEGDLRNVCKIKTCMTTSKASSDCPSAASCRHKTKN